MKKNLDKYFYFTLSLPQIINKMSNLQKYRVRVLFSGIRCSEFNYLFDSYVEAADRFEFYVQCCLHFDLDVRCVNIFRNKKCIKYFQNYSL